MRSFRPVSSQPATAKCILHHTYLLEYALTLQNTILCPQCSFLLGAVDTFWQAPPSAFQAMLAFVKNKMLSMRWSFPTRRQTALSHRHVTNPSFFGTLHVPISLFERILRVPMWLQTSSLEFSIDDFISGTFSS